ncbi:VapE domain-containing protein [Thiohalophilus sp.]|uniref:VapE domain-containing protein n=1 Tax=Thiohalophilus sp. TaxID=3028392 RepID=UPI003A0FD924
MAGTRKTTRDRLSSGAQLNQDAYLRDYSGNRRFWPVYCPKVHKDWARKNREQLWAEALDRVSAGREVVDIAGHARR